MHIDLEQLEAGSSPSASFCIIGGGIAGLILARKLASFNFDVMLLEAGGLDLEDRSQSLYATEMAASTHTGTTDGRFRAFGGSSIRWGGQLLPFTPDILAPLPGAPSASWPLAPSAISPYYDEVQRIFNVRGLPFTEELLPALGHPPVALPPQLRLRYSKWAPFSKRNLAQTVGRECLADPRIHIYTHANVASLQGDGATISSVCVFDYHGRSFTFTAQRVIVCCGTIESSRLLLSSPGVPNSADQIGRFFHDHVSLHAAVLPSAAKAQVAQRLGPFFVNGVLHTAKIEAVSELQRDAGLFAVMAHFVIQEPEDSGIAAVRNLLTSVQRGRLREALTRNLAPMLRGTGDIVRLLWSSKVRKRRAVSRRAIMWLNIDLEQPASPENRIRLSRNTDELGLPKAIVDWRIGDAEYETARKFAHILKQHLEAAGFPEFDWTPGLLEGVRPAISDTYHAMGGLRMGLDPRTSVVDPDLKVHGLNNLYVASCAVYPSGGSSNPTFTLMALTLRLADHLRTLVATPS